MLRPRADLDRGTLGWSPISGRDLVWIGNRRRNRGAQNGVNLKVVSRSITLPRGLVEDLKAVSDGDSKIEFRLVNAPEANVSLFATVPRSPATNRLRTPAVVANVGTLRGGWDCSRISTEEKRSRRSRSRQKKIILWAEGVKAEGWLRMQPYAQ